MAVKYPYGANSPKNDTGRAVRRVFLGAALDWHATPEELRAQLRSLLEGQPLRPRLGLEPFQAPLGAVRS